MSLISLESVSKCFGKSQKKRMILQNITCTLPDTKITAITGPSGCGKSTLLSLIGLLQPPSSGKIIIDGVDCVNISRTRQSNFRNEYLGFIFQDFALLGNLNVFDNIALPLIYKDISGKERTYRVKKILDYLNIDHLENKYPCEISGGEKQRVAIGRILVHIPKIILADEPTGSLDPENGKFIFDCFRQIVSKFGTTIIVVTHDYNLAKMTDNLIKLPRVSPQ